MENSSLKKFAEDLSSSSPTPGGGAVAALNLTLAASLLEMVIQLSINKKRFSDFNKELTQYLKSLGEIRRSGLELMAEDEKVFKELMTIYKQENPGNISLDEKLKQASEPGIKVMKSCEDLVKIARKMTHITNENLVSDIEVAVANIMAATSGALSNIFINIRSLSDKKASQKILNDNLEKKIYISEACEIILQDTELP